ncbi:AGL216Wp [Eremothecium gossypii ATCC 10895]|uniref:AGL216Wp n=1 Tax=Eremothecium gossypii (strain ATCC 10895 / CBS 109.51 / FGSC 9923 / NRRL Y-1056) TaxID=284811 RepID=Q751C2_EREGS|nr:AGL216Wp [Eremothecium gossypii ATCC 10895]AAS54275.2 AGL216Wp [Eremothecium gossypii ATCC 10895]AEY98601.1 FAGL216Wp [Eremothecium gossypii FDAG1]
MAVNKVIQYQKMFQASTKPLWKRHPRSNFYLYPFYGLFALSLLVPIAHIPNAIMGIKAKRS